MAGSLLHFITSLFFIFIFKTNLQTTDKNYQTPNIFKCTNTVPVFLKRFSSWGFFLYLITHCIELKIPFYSIKELKVKLEPCHSVSQVVLMQTDQNSIDCPMTSQKVHLTSVKLFYQWKRDSFTYLGTKTLRGECGVEVRSLVVYMDHNPCTLQNPN